MIGVYLSPSTQSANTYIVGGTNERERMEALAPLIKERLEKSYECAAVVATLSLGLTLSGRPSEAKNNGCSVYLSLHTNAAGGVGVASSCAGAIGFYHPDSPQSVRLARALANRLDGVCPVPSNRSANTASGMAPFDGQGYGEIRSPHQLGLVPALIEINFHDNPETARYILEKPGEIAQALADGVADAFSLKARQSAPAEVRVLCGNEAQARDVAQAMVLLGYDAALR